MQPKADLKEGISDTTGFDILDAAALTHAYPVARKGFDGGYQRGGSGIDYSPLAHMNNINQANKENLDYNPISN